ncbi:MAG: dihydrofolate reductase [Lachnospiraceae bacterium]|nr:dihydrofolate reductase [Lachnospiraceae bacterium]
MKLIAAVDNNWGIGKNNKLLISIPDDMKFFRETTTGNVVVMGRKTLESFPNKRPLKDRINIVLTKDLSYKVEGATVCHSIEEVLEEIKQYDSDNVYIIGGGSIYNMFEPYCDTALITRIDYVYDADTHFPNLEDKGWVMEDESEEQTYFDVIYTFCKYTNASHAEANS